MPPLPHLRDTMHTSGRYLRGTPSSYIMKKGVRRERRHAERSLSSLGVFSLGSGSGFTVIFAGHPEGFEKTFRVSWSSKTECKENRSYIFF